MTTTPRAGATPWPEIESFIEAFEREAQRGRAEIRRYLPAPSHPRYLDVLCELVRIDLEHGWEQGTPRPLAEYRDEFPELFADSNCAELIAFEESRLKLHAERQSSLVLEGNGTGQGRVDRRSGAVAGLPVDPFAQTSCVLHAPGDSNGSGELVGSLSSWTGAGHVVEALRDLERSEPAAASKLARVAAALPAIGTDFVGFHLTAELGRGAFGRVYLAHQGDLANRPVALKVAANLVGESRTLAQLQHTNIVPIYSIHCAGPLQAVCMPYFGTTTLADVLAELRSHDGPPDSAEGLLSTLDSRLASAALADSDARPPASGTAEARAQRPGPLAGEPPAALRAMLRKLNYGEGVLWLGTRLAEGLAHAHERGILHRDLKPANILFADDGQPMLLDFNLAADTKLRTSPAGALLGGTLPYMAPEQIEALAGRTRTVDERSDLYALGIILFELLGRTHPFPTQPGRVAELLPRMLAERLVPPPRLRSRKGSVTPAVESIVRRCLEPQPEKRYASVRDLLEDLQRQLEHRPLAHAPEPSLRERAGKWIKRHPRVCSSFSVALLAGVLLVAVVAGYSMRLRHLNRLEAVDSLRKLEADLASAHFLLSGPDALPTQRAEGLALCASAAAHYGALDRPGWKQGKLVASLPESERKRLLADMGELFLVWARAEGWGSEAARAERVVSTAPALRKALQLNQAALGCFQPAPGPRALWQQRAHLERLAGNTAGAHAAEQRAETIAASSARDQFWLVASQVDSGRTRAALEILKTASRENPHEATVWLLLGHCYAGLAKPAEAEQCYSMGLALDPRMPWAYFERGYLRLNQKNYAQAAEDFSKELAKRPGLVEARFNRALARLGQKDPAGAIADLNLLLEQENAPTRALFVRARAKAQLGDRAGALADQREGLKREPNDEASWVARGVSRVASDPNGALADFEQALRMNPSSRQALEDKASVLSEKLGKRDEAIAVLDRAIALHPEYVPARAGRGVLLARMNKREPALADAEAALRINEEPATQYQAACIFALTSRQEAADKARALRLLASAFRADPAWIKVSARDHDLDPLRQDAVFVALVQAASALARGLERPDAP